MTFKVDTSIVAYSRMEYLQHKYGTAGLENAHCICSSFIILMYFFHSFIYEFLYFIFIFP